jgi:hypothetical protein
MLVTDFKNYATLSSDFLIEMKITTLPSWDVFGLLTITDERAALYLECMW